MAPDRDIGPVTSDHTIIPEVKMKQSQKTRIVLRTDNLVKKYGKIAALDSLNMNVPEKSIYGLVGPNGAGKTTTLGILATLVHPNSGDAFIYDISVRKDPEKVKRLIGILPQNANPYPNRTAIDIMIFYSKLAGMEDAEKYAHALLDKVGLKQNKYKRTSEMSHGMVKLFEIAQALIGNPKVVMLDEPTSGLDPSVTYNIRKLVKSLKKDTTIIFSSHNLYEVQDLCDYIGIITHGKIIAEGKTKAITRNKSLEKVFMEKVKGESSDL